MGQTRATLIWSIRAHECASLLASNELSHSVRAPVPSGRRSVRQANKDMS